MKFSWGWLCDYLNPVADALEKLATKLTQAGIEVEKIVDNVPGFEIVKVETVRKHPDSDHLNICTLVGHANKTIVCGASNVRPGIRTVLANIGAIVPKNGFEIKETLIRGVKSDGMLCSPSELGIFVENDSDGIIDLRDDQQDINEIMLPNGPIFDVGITPNRGDWLSVYGIAREMCAFGLGELKSPRVHASDAPEMSYGSEVVQIEDDAILSMYTLEVTNTANRESPAWMKQRLTEVGINPKSAIVDITNYIAHALGQPLHAFNGDVVTQINIKRFTGEFVDLKERAHSIADLPAMISNGVCVSVPGVIGGKYGKCEENSSKILLEAANYARDYIYKAQKMVTNTDASKKFFYGVDPEMTTVALLEGAAMIQKYCGGAVQNFKCAREFTPRSTSVTFPEKYLADLGIDKDFAHKALQALGFTTQDTVLYSLPSWRNDTETSESLLTEIVRMFDVNRIEEIMFAPDMTDPASESIESKLRTILVSEGLFEILTRDFMSKEMNDIFAQDESLLITNPMSKAQYALRNSLLPSMIEVFDTYLRYKWQVEGLFDIGPVFSKNENDTVSERQKLCIALPICDRDWLSSNLNQNFYTAKRLVEKIVKYCFGNNVTSRAAQSHVALENVCEWQDENGNSIGYFGVFGKAEVMKSLKIKSRFYVAEIEYHAEKRSDIIHVSDQETLSKDLSLLLPKDMLVADLIAKMKSVLPDVEVFDLYPDGTISRENRSVGLRFYWRNLEKTMTSDELHSIMKIAESAAEEVGCVVRES